MNNLVTGGAGFIGTHLIKKLLKNHETVVCVDNFYSSNKLNIEQFFSSKNFTFIEKDITEKFNIKTDRVWHLACPASPRYYEKNPIKTSKINFTGTLNMLEIARKNHADFLLASTSEIYGNPEQSPQVENYNGSVNTLGKRSCYKEGKRIAETLCYDYLRTYNLNIKIARIFNTYGPNMMPKDGRVISNFITNAIQNKPLLINGDGRQTRSFCFIDDLIDGLLLFMNSQSNGPINFGNPNEEYSIDELAEIIINKLNSKSKKIKVSSINDETIRRKPCIKKAIRTLDWFPKYPLDYGLEYTIKYLRDL